MREEKRRRQCLYKHSCVQSHVDSYPQDATHVEFVKRRITPVIDARNGLAESALHNCEASFSFPPFLNTEYMYMYGRRRFICDANCLPLIAAINTLKTPQRS